MKTNKWAIGDAYSDIRRFSALAFLMLISVTSSQRFPVIDYSVLLGCLSTGCPVGWQTAKNVHECISYACCSFVRSFIRSVGWSFVPSFQTRQHLSDIPSYDVTTPPRWLQKENDMADLYSDRMIPQSNARRKRATWKDYLFFPFDFPVPVFFLFPFLQWSHFRFGTLYISMG